MRRNAIAHVLCLSAVLIVIFVKSQTSCPAGWFGSRCNYKCRCVNDKCDQNGVCIDPFTCLAGWFGPECQYTDVTKKAVKNSILTDGNESTCVAASAPDTVTISFESIFFTWLRVCVQEQGSAELEDLSVTFSSSTTSVGCSDLTKVPVDKKTLDVHCNFTEKIDTVTLKGASVTSLCSVYVSGGRNVALKEMAKQDSISADDYNGKTQDYPPELAVDGNRRGIHYDRSCARTDGTPTWTLTLSQTRMVNRYLVFNRVDYYQRRLRGFILESFDSKNTSLFVHRDTLPNVEFIYTVIHIPLPVKMVVITVNNTENILQICEVEVYGDSLCDNEHYGRDCELRCQCFGKVPCFATTGWCRTGCPHGYHGQGCLTECSPGQFGKGCSQTCSSNCVEPKNSTMGSCNSSTGACFEGCKIGFTGERCERECVGTFGQDCNQTCSLACEQPDNSSMSSCSRISGACLMGCKSGYSGEFCDTECVGTFGQDCNQTCSLACEQPDNSIMSLCNHITGECHMGCKLGYSGARCDTVCAAETFGKDCKSECNKNCQKSGNANSSACDPTTGACLKGCKEGSSGERCESVASETSSEESSYIELIVGLCSVVATAFTVGYCLRKKKRTRPSDEATVRGAGG